MGGWQCPACNGDNLQETPFCGWCATARETEEQHDEQRLVSALFADISGFTTLADRLDAERLHDVISPVISVLAGIAEDYGGTLAKYAGDAVLVFFGAPVAQEDHAVRAALTALDMHKALAEALPRLGPEARGLELHIGINSGRVIAGMFGGDLRNDYSILGDAVNVAQRLESVAPPGETYVGEVTQQLIAADFDVEPLGALELKGKTKPVDAWRLVGRQAISTDTAPPSRSVLVGREQETQTALDAIEQLQIKGSIFTVTAEPGGGKTRLTEEIRTRAQERGVRWLEARCISYGAGVAYYPYVDLLRRTYGISIEQDPATAATHLRDQLSATGNDEITPYFARVLGLPAPAGVADISSLEPAAFQRELHDAFATWLLTLLRQQAVVLAVEDAHWSDTTSLELTTHLARIARERPLLLYVTGRPESITAFDQISTALTDDQRVDIVLGPLDRAATYSLIESTLDAPPADDLVDLVRDRSGGNPFFAQELARSLHDSGGLALLDGVWQPVPDWDSTNLPPTIEGVLAGRIDMLSRIASHTLQVASVIGKRVNTLLLEAVAEDVTDLHRQVDRLIADGFLDRMVVDDEEVLTFHHALVVDVAYSRLVRRERRDLHRRVGEAAEVVYGTGDDVIDLLARHFYLAEAGVKAVDYLEKAGVRSEQLFANQEAILHFDRAVELARANPRVASRLPNLILHLADLEDLTGDYDDAAALYDEVRQAANDVRAWRGLAAVYRKRGDLKGAVALTDEAFREEAIAPTDLAPLWLERARAFGVEGRFIESTESALAGLQVLSPPTTELAGELLLQLARWEIELARLEEAMAHVRRAKEIFESVGNLRGLSVALRVLGNVYNQIGGHEDESEAALRRGLEIAERIGNAEETIGCLINLGLFELWRGNVEDGIACDRRAISEAERVGLVPAQVIGYLNLAEKLTQVDAFDEADAYIERGMALAAEIGHRHAVADAQRTLAALRRRQGFHTEANSHATEAHRLFLELGDEAGAADALTAVEETEEAAP